MIRLLHSFASLLVLVGLPSVLRGQSDEEGLHSGLDRMGLINRSDSRTDSSECFERPPVRQSGDKQ